MKIRAIHEIVYAHKGERHTVAPGTVVDIPAEVLGLTPGAAFVVLEDTAEAFLAGVVQGDSVVQLADMKKDELVAIANDMGIDGAKAMRKDELVAAIQAERVELPAGDDDELV